MPFINRCGGSGGASKDNIPSLCASNFSCKVTVKTSTQAVFSDLGYATLDWKYAILSIAIKSVGVSGNSAKFLNKATYLIEKLDTAHETYGDCNMFCLQYNKGSVVGGSSSTPWYEGIRFKAKVQRNDSDNSMTIDVLDTGKGEFNTDGEYWGTMVYFC